MTRDEGQKGDSPDIQGRTEEYAVRLFQHLQEQSDRAGWIIGKQYLRAATSIGANIEEARGAESRRDFAHKCRMKIILRTGLIAPERVQPLLDETGETYAVLTAIIRKAERSA
jgi:four helix bundle protein